MRLLWSFTKGMSCLGWRTKAQLLVMYHANEDLVNSIIRSKQEAGLSRAHPDLPNDPEATLFYARAL